MNVPFPAHLRHVDLIMNGPVETVSIPVPLHVGHLSGLDPGSLPVPEQDLHVSMMLTYMSWIAYNEGIIKNDHIYLLPYRLHWQLVEMSS